MDILTGPAGVRWVGGYLKSNIWHQIWRNQGGRCFKCAMPIKLNKACKTANSLNVICPDCYSEPEITAMWFEEAAPVPKTIYEKLSEHEPPENIIKRIIDQHKKVNIKYKKSYRIRFIPE